MMMSGGMNCVRLNFSHGTHDEHKKRAEIVRELNKKYRRHIRVLGDLEGFRMRVGNLKKPVELRKGEIIRFTTQRNIGEGKIIPFDCSAPLKIKPGYEIYMDDGNIAVRAIKVERGGIKAEVMRGGLLKERKGVNIPQADVKFPPLTEKDKMGIQFAVENRFDYLAQSFVRGEGDVLRVKELVKDSLPECKIIAKIESRTALKNIDEIIEVSNGIMIARGDLGISIPVYQVPVVQKEIVRKCKKKGKFVIVATQMLESMTDHPLPTRAEVSDVANAVFDGADAVMLSAETAVGKYPVEAVRMMNQIIKFTEKGTPTL
jgi:pyruvate kinase